MRFAFALGPEPSPWHRAVQAGLRQVFAAEGHEYVERPDDECGLVFHAVDPARPRPYPRKSRATFVVGFCEMTPSAEDIAVAAYPILVRSISNMLLATHSPDAARPLDAAMLLTPERGCYPVRRSVGDDPFVELYQRLEPLASSHLIIDNVFDPDLPPDLWDGTPQTDELIWASRQIDSLQLLPAPFPIAEVLGPVDYAYLRRLYGIGGLSYGNLSIRHDATRFWMSASGVNKGRLEQVGRDVLLVKGFDPEANAIRLSVRPDVPPHRVSVDAIEHSVVYQRFPELGAILHVHAWLDGELATTTINYPCGTVEMGHAMAAVLEALPEPGRAVVGMPNHGITATGPNLHDIIERISGHVRTTVPAR